MRCFFLMIYADLYALLHGICMVPQVLRGRRYALCSVGVCSVRPRVTETVSQDSAERLGRGWLASVKFPFHHPSYLVSLRLSPKI